MVKIFTMVKDEVDIIRDWIIYHGSLFGYNNIYVIDNYSTDGTYEILKEYSKQIFIIRKNDYKNKGLYMTELIKNYCKNEIAFPIDVDEFIVYYDDVINIDKTLINNYINKLPSASVYKCNYIFSQITNENGYERATVESQYGCYHNLGSHAKSFINTKYYSGIIDHGNHIPTDKFLLTKICLIHYHSRNLNQMKKKILNNVLGLGYPNDINALKRLLLNNDKCPGNHHVKNQINVLENTFILYTTTILPSFIDLSPFAQRIKDGYF